MVTCRKILKGEIYETGDYETFRGHDYEVS